MKIHADDGCFIEICEETNSDYHEIVFQCNWCAGRFKSFITENDLEQLNVMFKSNSKNIKWINEFGSIDITIENTATGRNKLYVSLAADMSSEYASVKFEMSRAYLDENDRISG